jgi:glycosyltransferase involved in cell wall biosynthesis
MKILYLSCHETLECDELKVLDSLGHQVFSIGHYTDPENPLHPTREGKLDIKIDKELLQKFKYYHNYEKIKKEFGNITIRDILNVYYKRVHREFAKNFDAFVIAHFEDNLTLNWESFKGKPIIVRYIGQPQSHFSPYINKTKKVAYSETEKYISRFSHFDDIIYPYVDTNYYNNWKGEGDYVLTINKWMKKRGGNSAWNTYLRVTSEFNRVVGGFENEDIPFAAGDLSPAEIQKLRQNALVYFSTCTKPGPFTYSFIEALSTGIPLVSIGPKLGSSNPERPTFMAHKFIENGVSGFWSDDEAELKKYIKILMNDADMRKSFSVNGRLSALKNFSFEQNKKKWKEILEKI